MRRIILFGFLLCGLSALCFAKGSLELFGGLPLNWDKGTAYGQEAEVQMTSVSFGFGFVSPINERVSLGVRDELIIPQKLEGTIDGEKVTLGRSDYKSLMGMSVFIGPVINLYSSKDGKAKIPLTLGMRWMWLSMSTEYAAIFGSQFGFAAGIGGEYHFNEKIYLFGRVMGYYDFFAMNTTTTAGYNGPVTTIDSGLVSSFGFTPNIGVGITF